MKDEEDLHLLRRKMPKTQSVRTQFIKQQELISGFKPQYTTQGVSWPRAEG